MLGRVRGIETSMHYDARFCRCGAADDANRRSSTSNTSAVALSRFRHNNSVSIRKKPAIFSACPLDGESKACARICRAAGRGA